MISLLDRIEDDYAELVEALADPDGQGPQILALQRHVDRGTRCLERLSLPESPEVAEQLGRIAAHKEEARRLLHQHADQLRRHRKQERERLDRKTSHAQAVVVHLRIGAKLYDTDDWHAIKGRLPDEDAALMDAYFGEVDR